MAARAHESLHQDGIEVQHIGQRSVLVEVRQLSGTLDQLLELDEELFAQVMSGQTPTTVQHFSGTGYLGHAAGDQRVMTIADLEQATSPRSAQLPSGETIELPGNPALAVIKVPGGDHLPGEMPGYEVVVVDRVYTDASGRRVVAIRNPQGPSQYVQLEESFLQQFDGRGVNFGTQLPPPEGAEGSLAGVEPGAAAGPSRGIVAANRTGAPLLDDPPPGVNPDGTVIGAEYPADIRNRGLRPAISNSAEDRVVAAVAMAADSIDRPIDIQDFRRTLSALIEERHPLERALPSNWIRAIFDSLAPPNDSNIAFRPMGRYSRIRLTSPEFTGTLDELARLEDQDMIQRVSTALSEGRVETTVEEYIDPRWRRQFGRQPMTIDDLERQTNPPVMPSSEYQGSPALAVVRVPAAEHPPGGFQGYELVVVDKVFRLPSGERVLAIRSPRGPAQYLQLEESFLLQFDGRGLYVFPVGR